MIKLLCVCGNGMGTSTILKINLKNICKKHNLDVDVESCAAGEAMAYINGIDLIITSPEWANMIPPSEAKIVQTQNLINVDEIEKTLLDALKQYFPKELKG